MLRKMWKWLINYEIFWKGDKAVPGVADSVHKTNLKKQQVDRKREREELLRMVKEDRLHEADERQLETLKLAMEINSIISPKSSPDHSALTEVVKMALAEALKGLPAAVPTNGSAAQDPSRPGMRHVSLADIHQPAEEVQISHISIEESKVEDSDGASKLEKLKRLKGNG